MNVTIDRPVWRISLTVLFSETLRKINWQWLSVCALLVATASYDFSRLAKYPIAVGIDGYYYVLQVSEFWSHHHFYFSTSTPFVLYFLTGINYLTGNPILAVKLGAAILHTFLCIGIFLLILTCTRSQWLGMVGSGLAALSGLHLYMITEFVSNLGAIALLVWCCWSVVRFVQSRKVVWAICSLLLLTASVLSHRSALVIVILFSILLGVMECLFSIGSEEPYLKTAPLLVLILWLTPALLGMQKLLSLPARLEGQFSGRPKWPFDHYAFPEEIVLLVTSLAVLLLIFQHLRRFRVGDAERLFGLTAISALVVTLNPFLNPEPGWLGIAERIRVLSYVQVAILVPGMIWLLLRWRRELAVYCGALVVPMMIVSMSLPLPRGMQSSYLERRQELIQSLEKNSSMPGLSPIIIAPHGDQYVVTATLGIASQQRPPENTQHYQVFWLLNEVTDPTSSGSVVLFKNDHRATILIADTVLKRRWEAMTTFDRNQLLATNPHLAKSLSLVGVSIPK